MQHDPAHPEHAQPGGEIVTPMLGAAGVGGGGEAQPAQRVGVLFAFGDLHLDVGIGGQRGLQRAELIRHLALGVGAFDAKVPAAAFPAVLIEIPLARCRVDPLFDQQIIMRRRPVGVIVNVSRLRLAARRAGAAVRAASGGAVAPMLIAGAVAARRRARFVCDREWRVVRCVGRAAAASARWPAVSSAGRSGRSGCLTSGGGLVGRHGRDLIAVRRIDLVIAVARRTFGRIASSRGSGADGLL